MSSAVQLKGSDAYTLIRGSFLACEAGVDVETKMQNLIQGLFSRYVSTHVVQSC
jgi:uncharacterized protein (AIM24 family)